jgi:DNA-binding transcriptional ArsR family regulator
MKHSEDIADPRVIKALSHPLRVQILALLDGRVRSPKELADELAEPLGNVSYHVRTLAGLGLIKLVKKVPRRGAIEHYYQAREHQMLLSGAVVRVDEAGRQELGRELSALVDRALKIAAASEKRAAPRDLQEMNLAVMLSELPAKAARR